RKIRQVSFSAGKEESHGQRRGVPPTSSADATLVLIFSPIGPPLVLFQAENPRIHGSQGVAKLTPHPSWKRRNRNAYSRCSWIGFAFVQRDRGQIKPLNLRS